MGQINSGKGTLHVHVGPGAAADEKNLGRTVSGPHCCPHIFNPLREL